MARKYFKSDVHQIAGPNKALNLLSTQTEISKQEADAIVDKFFDQKADNAEEMKETAWDFIHAGRSVQIGGVSLTSKKSKA